MPPSTWRVPKLSSVTPPLICRMVPCTIDGAAPNGMRQLFDAGIHVPPTVAHVLLPRVTVTAPIVPVNVPPAPFVVPPF